MKLRTKTLLIVVSTLLLLLAAIYGASRSLLMAGFAKVEKEDTERNVKRVLDAFTEIVNNLNIKASDWAKWDDTYKFIEDKNQDYIQSNLTDESLKELKLSIMLFVDTNKNVIFEKSYDPITEKASLIDNSIKEIILNDTALMKMRDKDAVKNGFILLPDGPMTIVSRPILTSEGKGPIHGVLIFAKYLDSTEVNRLGNITHLALSVFNLKSNLTQEITLAKDKLSYSPIFTIPLGLNRIAGYSYVNDIHNTPILITKIEVPRDIFKQGSITRIYLLVAIFISGAIFGIIILLLLEKLVKLQLMQDKG